MKYNFQDREKYWREFWDNKEIYKFDSSSQKPFYLVDTPPPYVSADHLHVGHIMSYSQAEFIVRYKRMRGYEVFYPMGFDDNGLPTERFVEKKYKINKNEISRSDFIKKCLEETKIGSQTYKNLWQEMGISIDWSKTYSTINEHSQRVSQWSFIDLYKKGKMTRKDEPSYWCTTCQTAVAQADLEDKEEDSFLNYINFKSADSDKNYLISTSRPELLAACVALFVNPEDKRYQDVIGRKAIVPIFDYEVPILSDEDVDIDFGTGMMMVCTWGDGEDVKKSKKHNLEIRSILQKNGRLNELAGEFANYKIKEARQEIIEKLKASGHLQKQESINHVLNVHERCSTPVELIKAKQWFINVLESKEELIKQADKMNWYPEFMKQRYIDWVQALKWDWCISRQRYYGVPFPIWYCQKCGEVILPKEESLPVDPINSQPDISSCPKCGAHDFVPENDVMDTWMTSSCTPIIISKLFADKKIQDKLYPSSLRPQAFEIIRTWLFYTVVKSFYHFNDVPFKDIMISGHGLDDSGQKISKRLGNFVPPEKIIERYGADSLRYWATGANLGENLRYNEDEVKKGNRTITKLHNASEFCFSHFKGEDYSQIKIENLEPADKWILHYLNETLTKVTEHFDAYQYAKAKGEIDNFFWAYFCDNYLEFIKHRLYREESDQVAKSVLYQVMLGIIKMYAPIMPYITEEIYHSYFDKFEKDISIHLSKWPEVIKKLNFSQAELDEFSQAVELIKEIRKFKSANQFSLAVELDDFQSPIAISEKHREFVSLVGRVKNIIIKS
ncbi:MAG: valine--tRNA ligase [Patescibacteria group bacterium]